MNYKATQMPKGNIAEQKFASYISLVIGIIVLVAKFAAYRITGSNAIYSDALESIINVVTAVVLVFVIGYAVKPADRDHPYGHGKVEYFSAAFEGGLISFAALFIIIGAIQALIYGHTLQKLDTGLIIVSIAGLINLGLGIFLMRVGKKRDSKALVASGQHIISDFWTSFGIIVGLIFVKLTGLIWVDNIAAIIVGIFLAKTGFSIVKSSAAGLMDEENPEAIDLVAKTFEKHMSASVIQIHNLKMIRSGQYHHIDAHLVVPEFWDVKMVHKNIEQFERNVVKDYPYHLELHFHLDPCRRVYCKHCDVPNCPIRRYEFKHRLPLNVEQLTAPEEPDPFI